MTLLKIVNKKHISNVEFINVISKVVISKGTRDSNYYSRINHEFSNTMLPMLPTSQNNFNCFGSFTLLF